MSEKADIQRDARRQFARPGSAFDRLIAALRVVLPAGVGTIVAILALSPVESGNEFSFLLDRNDVARAGERLHMTSALYRGEDSRGEPFSLRARSATQRSSREPVVEIDGLLANFAVEGDRTLVTAERGDYHLDSEQLRVPGSLRLDRANGDSMTARNVIVDLAEKEVRSASDRQGGTSNGVTGSTGFGSFAASAMRAGLAEREMVLTGGVTGRTGFGRYRADSLTYDFGTGNVVLEGGARMRIDRRR